MKTKVFENTRKSEEKTAEKHRMAKKRVDIMAKRLEM